MSSNEKVLSYLKKKYPLEKNTPDKPTTVVILDGQQINHITDDIKNYLENFKDLEELTLSFCNLSTLKNLPDLPKLSKIELNDNHFKGDELSLLCKYKNLSELRIANNNINNFDEIKCLENLPELTLLDFTDSAITKSKNYREEIFKNFKKLKVLDGIDKNGNVVEDEDEDEEDELEEDKEFIDDEKKEGEEEEEEKKNDKLSKINNKQNNISVNSQQNKVNNENVNMKKNYENKNDDEYIIVNNNNNNINKINNNNSSDDDDDDDKNSLNLEKNDNINKDKKDEKSESDSDKESSSSDEKSDENKYLFEMDNLLTISIKNLFNNFQKEKQEKNFNKFFLQLKDIPKSKNKTQIYKDKLITLICIFFPFCSKDQKNELYDFDFIDEELKIYLEKTLLYYKEENEIYKKCSNILSNIPKKKNKNDKTKNLNFENKNLLLKSEDELFILYIFLIIYKVFGSYDKENKKTFDKKYYLKEFYYISFKLYFILSHQEYYPCITDNFLEIYERLLFIKKFYTESLTNKFEKPYIISKIKNVKKEENTIGYIYNDYILGEQKDSDIKKLFSEDELDINEKVLNTIKHFYKIDEDKGIDLLKFSDNPELDKKQYNFIINIVDIIYQKKYINIKNINSNLPNLEKKIQNITKHIFNKKGDNNNQKYSRSDKKEIFVRLIKEIKSELKLEENIFFYPVGSVTEFLFFNEKNNHDDDLNISIDMHKLNPFGRKNALHKISKYLKDKYKIKKRKDSISKNLIFKFKYEDININITLIALGYGPYIHSILFRAYSLMDPRFPIVGLTLKYFLRKIGLDNTNNNHSHYTYTYTFIFISLLVTFLQDIIQPPVLPKIFNDKISPISFITMPFSNTSNADKFKINTFIDELKYKPIYYPKYIFDKERLENIYNEQIGNNKNKLTCTEIFLYFLEFLIYYFKYDTVYANTSLQFEGFDSINNILNDEDEDDEDISIKYPNDIYFKEFVRNNLSIERNGKYINKMKGFLLIKDPVNPFYNPGDILDKKKFDEFHRKIKIGHDILLDTGDFEQLKKIK